MPLTTPELKKLDRALRSVADPKHRAVIRDHFGSNVDRFYGAKIPDIRKMAEATFRGRECKLTQRWQICNELTSTGIFEHKIAAFHLARLARKEWTGVELPCFSNWLHQCVDDWMDTDDLCLRVIGEFLLRFPDQATVVVSWKTMPGVWSRRGSAVSLVPAARKGAHWPLVAAVCDEIMDDAEPMVTKACGWLLKVASQNHPEKVRQFVTSAGSRMPSPVRRTALEKLM